MKTFVAPGAAFQLPSPACEAATATVPAPVNVSVVPFVIEAGPETTAKETSSPLDADAANATAFVAVWSPMAGKSIVWFALARVVTVAVSEGAPAPPAFSARTRK